MTQHHLERPSLGGICQRPGCQHDLLTRTNGFVYCTNPKCCFHTEPHRTGFGLNSLAVEDRP